MDRHFLAIKVGLPVTRQPPYRSLRAVFSHRAFMVAGLTNKILRERLADTPFARKRSRKQLSAKISRHLLLLRKHGVIRKLPRQNRYQLTVKGMRLVNALHVLLDASTENILKNAA